MGTKVVLSTVGKGFMQLFVTHDGQTWDISPYVSASFNDHTLRVFSKEDINLIYTSYPAELGESFYVHVYGKRRVPAIVKADMPENRGDKILWALSFAQSEKRTSSLKEFFKLQQNFLCKHHFDSSFVLFCCNSYAFHLTKRPPKMGKGLKAKNPKFKPQLGWCCDNISKEELDDFIKKYQCYRKIYVPIEFIYVL